MLAKAHIPIDAILFQLMLLDLSGTIIETAAENDHMKRVKVCIKYTLFSVVFNPLKSITTPNARYVMLQSNNIK
jgi:hypothetical protein